MRLCSQEEFPEVLVLADLYHERPEAFRDMTYNEFQMRAMARSASFVTVQGGISYFTSYFGGCNAVGSFFGITRGSDASKPSFSFPPCPPNVTSPSRPERRLDDSEGSNRASSSRRRLFERKETYMEVLPRMGGGVFTEFREGRYMVEAIEEWVSNPLCRLVPEGGA